MQPELQAVVLIPHLWVQNANAIASPMSYGFPAITAFTGAVHAIERALNDVTDNANIGEAEHAATTIRLKGVGVVCHTAEAQTNRESGYVMRFNLRRDPVGADGASAALVEEGRMHLDVSLVIGIESGCPIQSHAQRALARRIDEQLRSMRLAGGSVLPHPMKALRKTPRLFEVPPGDDARKTNFRKLTRLLLPGFALIGRHALLAEYLSAMQDKEPQATSLDALLDLCALHWGPEPLDEGDAGSDDVAASMAVSTEPSSSKTQWQATRRKPGWLVPIPVGYAAISEVYAPGVVKRSRDPTVPFRFVENVLSLGEWKSPHRLTSLDELLWHHAADPDKGLYLVKTVADTASMPALNDIPDIAAIPA